MNRREKRRAARHARTPEDIFPGGHLPPQPNMAEILPTLMRTLEACLPGCNISLFVAEKLGPEPGKLPRFNYISNSSREDMVAVLEAFAVKHKPIAAELDKLEKEPPSGPQH